MSVEDGAVLGRLFSHLRSRDQVNQLLWAFQDIRQPRCAAATESEMHNMHFQCMPNGADQETRDAGLRAKLAAGVQVLQAGGDQEETPEWREVKEIFGYDAEDETDDWWVGWGSLKYRSAEYGSIGIQVEQTVSN
jgi:salicylate hydroxylase